MTMRLRLLFLCLAACVAVPCLLSAPVLSQSGRCPKEDFEGVVDQAAARLHEINQKSTGEFQARLRALKQKRGWSNEAFLKEGATYVRDDEIIAFEEKTEDLLARLNASGTVQGATADCRLLADLKKTMQDLVETQQKKWTYMFGKVDADIAK